MTDKIKEIIEEANNDISKENGNINGTSAMGKMQLTASTKLKEYALDNLLSKKAKEAHNMGLIHIHDLDLYPLKTTTCLQIPLGQLLKKGFNTGHGTMRQPQSIGSAMALASIIFQANQNQQHGGQAMPMFDYDLAPYIKKTYEKQKNLIESINPVLTPEQVDELAWKLTDKATFQACEGFIHNSNSMHSRGGAQVPFISINYGTDTSKEGRMLIKNMLLATEKGLGKGETPIFPIQIFKVKEGVNYEEGAPNHDLLLLALKITGKRLFPNYSFLDAPENKKYYVEGDPTTEIAIMGCRTKTLANINGKSTPVGRGNLSFTSINLPMIALESTDVPDFFSRLDSYAELVIEQLYERYSYQRTAKISNFSFLYGQGLWMDSEKYNLDDNVGDLLKHGTLAIGFIGLAECLTVLIGSHHGQTKEALDLGIDIVSFLREKADEAKSRYHLNFSLIATPSESYCGKALKTCKAEYGLIPGVTDKKHFTNSSHIPVGFKISAVRKIEIESKFIPYENGGNITYIELTEDSSKNIEGMYQLLSIMKENNIEYGSFNVPVDQCKKCGFVGVIDNECPSCGIFGEKNFSRIRRITGYLVGSIDKWNDAKLDELNKRVKHS